MTIKWNAFVIHVMWLSIRKKKSIKPTIDRQHCLQVRKRNKLEYAFTNSSQWLYVVGSAVLISVTWQWKNFKISINENYI